MKKPKKSKKDTNLYFWRFPKLLTFQEGEDHVIKNEPIFGFKDLIDISRYYSFLMTLSEKESKKKMKRIRKLYPDSFF